jgi:hypothetical protein
MGLAIRLRMRLCLEALPTNRPGKGGADGVHVLDERRHPGQEDDEVQQDVYGHGANPHDERDPGVVEPLL